MAVIELAELRFRASVMIRSSIKFALAGAQVDWMMKTSRPRTLSEIWIEISPSENRLIVASDNGIDRYFATAFENSSFAVPEKTL